jgi:hypothetical protein
MSRRFAPKTEILTASGEHLRFVPGELARAMVAAGSAAIENANGKIRSVRLIQTAASHAHRIGEPTPPGIGGTKFVRRVRSENHAFVWWEFHPRSFDPPE